jgi:hypothetical protein
MDRHAFDPISFLFGAVYVAVGLVLLTGDAEALPLEWVGPAVAVGLGLLIVFAVRPRRPADEAAMGGALEADEEAGT